MCSTHVQYTCAVHHVHCNTDKPLSVKEQKWVWSPMAGWAGLCEPQVNFLAQSCGDLLQTKNNNYKTESATRQPPRLSGRALQNSVSLCPEGIRCGQ